MSIQLETIVSVKIDKFILKMLLWIAHIFQILVPEIAGHLYSSLIFSVAFRFMLSVCLSAWFLFFFWQKYCVQLDVLGNSFPEQIWKRLGPSRFQNIFITFTELFCQVCPAFIVVELLYENSKNFLSKIVAVECYFMTTDKFKKYSKKILCRNF